nr:retrovirus-related Pol polyprotein from transposon TNT 1-94 [Tanacetum cinerariifolium]
MMRDKDLKNSKSKSVTQNNVSNDFSKTVTAQTLPQNQKSILKNTNVLAPGILNAKTLNVKFVSAMSDKCVLIDKHDMCVLKSVTKPLKETVASESNNNPRNFTRKLYERVSKTCSWWYPKFTPSGYIWKPKSGKENVNPNLIEIVLFIVDSGCSKHMMGNLKLLINFVEKFLGMVKFGNDQIVPILGYGDLVQGAVTIKRVYYVEGLNHNLFSVGQFCDADLEVAFRKSTCFIRDLKGNDLLTGVPLCQILHCLQILLQLVEIVLFIVVSGCSKHMKGNLMLLINFMEKFLGTVKFGNDQIAPILGYGDLGNDLLTEGILHQTLVARTPEQNDVVERRNRTLVETARTMLSAAKVPLFFWAEAITTTCFTQNRSLVIPRHEKTPYHIINDRKPSVKFFHIFGSLCYIIKDGENLDKIKEKDRTVTTTNELDLLFSLMFDELLNGSSKVMSKSSAVSTADAPNQHRGETSSRHVDSSNMHTFYQRYPSEHRWTKDHPLEQVIGNPSQSVRTRRQLESDGEMCMFVLTVSRTEPKNIKEAMADSAWIESMQEELYQF